MRLLSWVRTTFAVLGLLTISSAAHSGVIISGDYYEETASGGPCTTTVCSVVFTLIPTGKAVLFKHLACSLRVSSAVKILRVEFGLSRPGQQPTRFQDLFFLNTGSTTVAAQALYVVQTDPHFLVGGGARPFLRLSARSNAITNIDCRIAGEI